MSILSTVTIMASTTEGASGGLLDSLGIDWKMLVLQSVAFLLLLFLLSKYVYPILLKSIDKREKLIEESITAAHDAEKNAKVAEEKVAKLMKDARTQAADIMNGAKDEAAQLLTTTETKARERAERMAKEADSQIARSVADARKSLRDETVELVAQATEKIVGKAVTLAVDTKAVQAAIKESDAS
jgi:F-type H+-transporting ATPase subunit b